MKQLRIFAILMAAVLMAGCDKNEDQGTGVGDVMIVSKQVGLNNVYGLSMYAYTFSEFSTVKAVSSADTAKIYTLKSNEGYKSSFYLETPDAEFTATKPVASTFNFSAIFENGARQAFDDILSDKALLPASIDTCEYNTKKHLLRVTWTPVTDAQGYAINIFDGSTLIFGSQELVSTAKAYSVSTNGNGWASGLPPVSGKTYTVKLFAYLYESVPKASYNIQAISIAEKTVVWGN